MLVKLKTAYNVEMHMHHGLTAVFATVIDHSETIIKAFDLSDFIDRLSYSAQILSSVFGCCYIPDIIEMLLGNNKHMYGCRRIDVVEAQHLIVLINLCRRDLTLDDITE